MSNRLNQEREAKLQPKRIDFAVEQLWELGIVPEEIDHVSIKFLHNHEMITYFPYSGWHSGKGITDGRGWRKLKRQIS